MSKLTATANRGYVELSMGMDPVPLTIEESRALRVELEKAEEEAARKSAYMTWIEERKGQSLPQAWNAAIEAAIAVASGGYVTKLQLRALKEPVE